MKFDDTINRVLNEKVSHTELITFLAENPSPSDDDFHEWAEKKGYDVHDAEAEAYKLAAKLARFLVGGRSNEKKITEKNVNPKQLEMGIKVEYEHTPDEDVSKKIALDHLAEMDDYYTKLAKMESEHE